VPVVQLAHAADPERGVTASMSSKALEFGAGVEHAGSPDERSKNATVPHYGAAVLYIESF
jgi:hypothetical protein